MSDRLELEDTLAFLTGRWQVTRVLVDHGGSPIGVFRGDLAVTVPEAAPSADRRALYREAGVLQLGAHHGEASRWLSCRCTDHGSLDTYLPSGTFFFELDLRTGRCEAEHPCGNDTYRITVRVASPDEIEERWHVTGPHKAYEAVATLTRLDRR